MKKVIIKELEQIKKKYAVPRRTQIIDGEAAVYEEEKVKEQEVVFLMDRFGYARLMEPAVFEKNAQQLEEENKYCFKCMNTDSICLFTQNGMMHQVKAAKVPLKKPKDKGVPIDNLSNYTSVSENIIQVAPMSRLKTSELLFTTKDGMMKFVDAAEFDVIKKTVAATKLGEGDEVVSIDIFDTSDRKVYTEFEFDDEDVPMISGGSEDGISTFTEDDDQLTFEFIDLNGGESEQVELDLGDPIVPEITDESVSGGETEQVPVKQIEKKDPFSTNKMVVLQTRDGVFLRFRLNEIPEKKKGAIGVRGIKLAPGDEIDKVYVIGSSDKGVITYHDKELELMKIKLAKRDGKGTKPRL